tara:strand:+ start:19873 stop:20499 length:627 start_codon:yes stop_codon:yes gene_type:complete
MNSTLYKLSEFFIIFILVPVSFSINFSPWIKLIIGFLGFIYVIYVLLKIEKLSFKVSKNIRWKRFWKEIVIKLFVIMILTTLFVWITNKDALFNILLNKPKLWIFILFVYSLFSVYPQELIYRTFYFQRYQSLIPNIKLFIFINAVVFTLAHLFFKNTLVIILTFLGGLIFAFTYKRNKSTLLVSIEHAIYGSWLFTVGMGDMLGFPA